jgi:hypothetical protein
MISATGMRVPPNDRLAVTNSRINNDSTIHGDVLN